MAEAPSKPVWFITGCSTGFGRELSVILLKRGYRVVVTARDKAKIDDIVAGNEKNGLALKLDVDKQDQIEAAVKAAEAKFGRIDVLVNNAGYGYLAAVEEGDDADVRAMFDTNFFGLAAMTRAVLPVMRAQKSGAIVNISSIGGFIGFPGSGYYAATKVRRRGTIRGAVEGSRAARNQGHHRRTRPLPHRLGGPVLEDAEEACRRLCGDGDRAPAPDPELQRKPAGRPCARVGGDHHCR
jgi:NADP-dependent 3-hydroxy acid dehydrogenase YdfG